MQYNFKNIKMLSLSSILAVIVGLGGCTSDFDAINTDNTKLSTVTAAEFPYMFSNALMASTLSPDNFEVGEGTYAGVYSQFYSQAAQSFPTDRYVMRLDWLPAAWNPVYIQAAPALKTILENTEEQSAENAVAKIWWVWMFDRVTDYFGPIPYFQAANGLGSVPSTPQDSIYYDFFKKLDAASNVLKTSGAKTPFDKFDLVYNSKGTAATTAWMKFANTLRLRLALRISKVDPAMAKTQAEAAVAAGVMTDVTDDAYVQKSNSVYAEHNGLSQIVAWDDIRMSSTMESILKGYDDPRLPIYFQPATFTGKYDGMRNGLLVSEKIQDINSRKYTSNLGPRWAVNNNGSFTAVFNTPQDIMHAAEAYFLRAEGALNGWNMGDNAQNLYETGIKMSMKQWGITDQAVIAKYIANMSVPIAPQDGQNSPPVNDYPVKWSADATMQRKQVAQQKWLGLFPDAMEGWADVRRTGLPKLYPIVHSENTDLPQGTFIRRVPFLDTEKQTNAAATAKAVEMLKGPDKVSTPLWWDKN
ncbi:SusD/RagB family nutrient-binding outer membrane lipoprotein [Dyadobacter luticola]|uniref:SusD/RagB family nutrient-binding outer membrane lipoprotein n=1 Tax=Dyadobacter luticola TaxID=1979387 RepID=A0A5R9KRT2_9BACT|nr:SusD/RagB family nutrient-binding outer membrane lipoprotein [Dyadobacter luticola]TLU98930.1 SusD/RagB family nutrient-binding outer membrane lipoprotein [Dyadobacter luticola]